MSGLVFLRFLGRYDALKAVLDIERKIADWWRELPIR